MINVSRCWFSSPTLKLPNGWAPGAARILRSFDLSCQMAGLRGPIYRILGAMAEGLETQIKALIAFLQVSAAEPHLDQEVP